MTPFGLALRRASMSAERVHIDTVFPQRQFLLVLKYGVLNATSRAAPNALGCAGLPTFSMLAVRFFSIASLFIL